MIPSEFANLLACPACDTHPALKQEENEFLCSTCGRHYPVKDGIVVLLEEEAVQ